jgi:hypothetical protein
MLTNKNHVGQKVALQKVAYVSVLALTDLPEVRDKKNWIRTSENYERICLNKQKTFLSLAFGQVRTKIKTKTVMYKCFDFSKGKG